MSQASAVPERAAAQLSASVDLCSTCFLKKWLVESAFAFFIYAKCPAHKNASCVTSLCSP